jgi:hypothetical protein
MFDAKVSICNTWVAALGHVRREPASDDVSQPTSLSAATTRIAASRLPALVCDRARAYAATVLDRPNPRYRSRDPDLRGLVHERLAEQHGNDREAVIVDELAICSARARVDIALVNGMLSGFEIKSDVDGFTRLASQATQYCRVFNHLTLVCAPRHVQSAIDRLPAWWAIWAVEPRAACPIDVVQRGADNPRVCIRATAGLLWRDEMLELLADHGMANGMLSKPRRDLVATLVAAFDEATLCTEVRTRLRLRLQRANLALSPGRAAPRPG